MPPSRFSHSRAKRSVLDDAAYEESLSFVSDKSKRFAGRIINKQTRRDLAGPTAAIGVAGGAGMMNPTLASLGNGGGGLASLSMIQQQQQQFQQQEQSTTVTFHDRLAVFTTVNNSNASSPTNDDSGNNNTSSSPRDERLEPLTPSQLLIKFIGYLPTRWLEAIVKALETEQKRQNAVNKQNNMNRQGNNNFNNGGGGRRQSQVTMMQQQTSSSSSAPPLNSTTAPSLIDAGDDDLLLRIEAADLYAETAEDDAQNILGMGITDQKTKAARRESNLLIQREATLLAVSALNNSYQQQNPRASASAAADASALGLASITSSSSQHHHQQTMMNNGATAAAFVGRGSTDGIYSTIVRTINPSTTTPLAALNTFLSHKQSEAVGRAVATFGAIKAEHTRVMASLKEQQLAINMNVKMLANAEENRRVRQQRKQQQQQAQNAFGGGGGGGNSDLDDDVNGEADYNQALAEERERKRSHTFLMQQVEERFRAANLMAVIAHLVHKRANEAKALVVLLRLFALVAEGGIAEESGPRDDAAATDGQYSAARRQEQNDERSFIARQNKTAMGVRDLLNRNRGGGGDSPNKTSPRGGGGGGLSAATASAFSVVANKALMVDRSHIPSSSSAVAAKWKLRYEQKKDNTIKTVIREVLLPFLLGRDLGAVVSSSSSSSSSADPPNSFASSMDLLESTALHMLFEMFPSQSNGEAMTATAMSVVSASNALYNGNNTTNANSTTHGNSYYGGGGGGGPRNLLGGLPTTNLLHLGLLLDAEQGTGSVILTESGDEVRMPWWYVTPWELSSRQEEALKLWQRFRPTGGGNNKASSSPTTGGDDDTNNGTKSGASTIITAKRDPNEDLLPTAADIFRRLYYSHRNPSDAAAVASAAMSAFIGADGFDGRDTLHALALCRQWVGTVDDRENTEEFIPSNVFPPLRPFLSFPFHATVQMSEPAKITLKRVLVPFVDGFWAKVVTTSAATIISKKDDRDEREATAARAAAEALAALYGGSVVSDEDGNSGTNGLGGGNSIFGPFVGGGRGESEERPMMLNQLMGMSDAAAATGADGDDDRGSPSSGATTGRRNKPPTAKEIEERRRAALAAKEAERNRAKEEAKVTAAQRQQAFEQRLQEEKNKEAIRIAKIENSAQEQTIEKEAKIAALNDPIVKARERLQQQILAASQLYQHNTSAAPELMPPRPQLQKKKGAGADAEEEHDRSEDFNFVTNKIRRPLDAKGLEAKFLGGGISGGAVTSSEHSSSASKRGGGDHHQSSPSDKGLLPAPRIAKRHPSITHRVIVTKKLVTVKKVKEDGTETDVEEEIEEVTEEIIKDKGEYEGEDDDENNLTAAKKEEDAAKGDKKKTTKNAIDFAYSPVDASSSLSPRSYPKHLFATDPYLAEAIASLDEEAIQARSEDAAEAVATRRIVHERAAEKYHNRVMVNVIDNRMQHKMDARRSLKEKSAREANVEAQTIRSGDASAFIPRQDDSRVDPKTGRFVPRPLSEADVAGFEHLSNRTAIARLYKNLGVLTFEDVPPEERDGVIADILKKEQQLQQEESVLLGGGSNSSAPLARSRAVAATAQAQHETVLAKAAAEKALAARSIRGTIFTQVGPPFSRGGPSAEQDGGSSSASPTTGNTNSSRLTTIVVQDYTEEAAKARRAKLDPRGAQANAPKLTEPSSSGGGVGGNNRVIGEVLVTANKRKAMTAEKDIGLVSFQPASALKD